ncbi:MAG: hypothetical protein HOB73_12120, partial [Planctomycetaceae bacterium]|nr:hypothetical protein [Planctomycetaceae bacterium]
MNRRNLLKLCGTAGLGLSAPIGRSLLANDDLPQGELPFYDGPYYVVFNAAGGWDTTYLMDPKGTAE